MTYFQAHYIRCLSIVLLISLQSTFTNAQPEPSRTQLLDQGLSNIQTQLNIAGLSVAVSHKGKLIYHKGFGWEDVEAEKAATDSSVYRLASVSKLLTISAIAKLVEKGKLDLDQPIEQYMPDYPHKGRGVTTRLICAHLAGIRHYKAKDVSSNMKQFDHTDAALATFIDDPLEHDPGSAYKYSTFGYVLLQGIIEAVSGESFLTYLEQHILQPLNMSQTGADRIDSSYAHKASLYKTSRKGEIKSAIVDNPSYKWGGGGMRSSVLDLIKFGEAHLKPGFYSEPTLDLLFHPNTILPYDESTAIGLGWRLTIDQKGDSIFHHAGNMNGARSLLLLYPQDEIVIAIQSNHSVIHRIETVGLGIKDILFNEGSINKAYPITEKAYQLADSETGVEMGSLTLSGSYPWYTCEIQAPSISKKALRIPLLCESISNDSYYLLNIRGQEVLNSVRISASDSEAKLNLTYTAKKKDRQRVEWRME